MKTQVQSRSRGFTLIEMVGVLAIIAILAALLVPRIMSAINESRFNSAVTTINTVRTAAISYFGKYGKFGGVNGAVINPPNNDWDLILVTEGYLDKPFETRLSTGTAADDHQVQLVAAKPARTEPTASNEAYNLDCSSTDDNEAVGTWVVQAVIKSVALPDAIELNNRIDGEQDKLTLGTHTESLKGRVKFTEGQTEGENPTGTGLADVYIYLAHK